MAYTLGGIRGESPDDVMDTLTNHKIGTLIDLEEKQVPYLLDIKLMLENEIAKEA